MTTPLTIDQITAAVEEPDWLTVDAQICELVGLDRARFDSWMTANGWAPIGQAAGNVHWSHAETGQHIWLDGLAVYAAELFIAAVTGEDTDLRWRIRGDDQRSSLEILREIMDHEVTEAGREVGEKWDGGGLLVAVPCGSEVGR